MRVERGTDPQCIVVMDTSELRLEAARLELALRFGHAEVADGLKVARRAAAAGLPDSEAAAPATITG